MTPWNWKTCCSEKSEPTGAVCRSMFWSRVAIYSGKKGDKLDKLRYQKYCEKVLKTCFYVETKILTPTQSAAKFHSNRVYYQVQTWLGNVMLNHLDWGWNVSDNVMDPRMTDMAPPPDNLLKMVKCNCKTDCRTARYSCKKMDWIAHMLVESVPNSVLQLARNTGRRLWGRTVVYDIWRLLI